MDKSREQFESWFKKEYETTMKDRHGDLIKFVSDQLFIVWQASRESLEIELPSESTSINPCGFNEGYNDAISNCKKILISNGVKIK